MSSPSSTAWASSQSNDIPITRNFLDRMIVSDPQTLVLRKNLVLPAGHQYRFVIHDRDSFFSRELDLQVAHVGVRVLRTPVRAPPPGQRGV